jgi:hypothetical protein
VAVEERVVVGDDDIPALPGVGIRDRRIVEAPVEVGGEVRLRRVVGKGDPGGLDAATRSSMTQVSRMGVGTA